MSQAVIFGVGAVIFVVVSTAVFLYGLLWFRDWQQCDEVPTDAIARLVTTNADTDAA